MILSVVVWLFCLYQSVAFSRELKAALRAGQVPPADLQPRMGFFWMLRNASIIPTGPRRRTLIVASWAVWGLCALAFLIVVLVFGAPHWTRHH
jgi:ABC-type multidrug transport system permease subunit